MSASGFTPKMLDDDTAAKLAKICGMFGSEHEGERATAAAMADHFVRSRGLTWPQVIGKTPLIVKVPDPPAWTPAPEPNDAELSAIEIEAILEAASYSDYMLSDWERSFVYSVAGRRHRLSQKQINIIARIGKKLKREMAL
jgi:hypothetical protein